MTERDDQGPPLSPPSANAPQVEVPSLTVLAGEIQRSFRLDHHTIIGRGDDTQLHLSNDEVSRHHALIERGADGRFRITDLDSKNGTRVNGVPIAGLGERTLEYGDRITLGRGVLLLFTSYDDLDEQILRGQRLEVLGRLAGGVAHDFNNLLSTVLTNLTFLRRLPPGTRLDEADVGSTLDDSETALRRAGQLTRQLLGFARQGKGHDRLTDFSEIALETVRMLRRTVDPAVVIDAQIEPGVVVLGDSNQLQQVVMNLMLNAADAMPNGGTIRVRLASSRVSTDAGAQAQASLEVIDNGEGMDEATSARAFEPFFTTKAAGRGTGLGLALVYGVAKAVGGDATLESKRGQGTTVRFVTPMSSRPDRPTPAGSQSGSGEVGGGTVLLVDDEDLFRTSTARLLRHLGFQVELAKSGQEAVELVRTRPGAFGVVLLDLVMPDMSGATTFHALRSVDSGIQVVLISGQNESHRVDDLLQAGALAFVPKPFEVETLRRELKAALGSTPTAS